MNTENGKVKEEKGGKWIKEGMWGGGFERTAEGRKGGKIEGKRKPARFYQ